MGRARTPRHLEATVHSIGADGLGTAQAGERLLRIKNALPGEHVTARVLKRRQGSLWGEALEVDVPAAGRVDPACGSFPRCGGCAMQHLSYEQQLALKEAAMLGALQRAEVAPLEVAPITTGPRFHYRSKARFGVRVVGGEVLVGFRESFSSRVGRMDVCPALVPSLSRLFGPLKSLVASLSRPDRVPQFEVAAGDEDVALVLRHLTPLTQEDRSLLADFGATHRLRCYTQSGGYDTVAPASPGAEDSFLGYGNPDYGIRLWFRPTDFTQVNMAMNRKLVRATVSALGAPGGSRVLDLFCGIGNFSLALAATGLNVLGLEASPDAVDRARLNAARNGLEGRCEFARQDLYDADCLNPGRAEFLLLDPPRSGAGPNLPAWIASAGARRIAYVSCSPTSFAADAAVLGRAGFVLERVGIFDMFPHTAHVETLGVFQKRW